MMTNYFDGKSVLDVQIEEAPTQDLALVIVIPAMNESDLLLSLEALRDCHPVQTRLDENTIHEVNAFHEVKPIEEVGPEEEVGPKEVRPDDDMNPSHAEQYSVEIITVINHSEGASRNIIDTNQRILHDAREWARRNSTNAMRFHFLYHPDLPRKKGGVGMARKIGMDEAARRLLDAGNSEGIIACFDADCQCELNYVNTLVDFFEGHSGVEGVSIHFEHPLEGLEAQSHEAIVNYELHLRYFIDAQRWADYPFAYQTVGSSMAVRASTYIKVGGMNTRKAGEDFYFLHKVIERGAHADLCTTTVFPSARSSDRVPFGTGKAVADLLDGARATTYSPTSFEDLHLFIDAVPKFYDSSQPDGVMQTLPKSIREFLVTQKFEKILAEIKTNTASQESFEKRLFRWFNAFRLMKYVHFARDHYYPDVPIGHAVDWLFEELGKEPGGSLYDRLIQLRELDKEQGG